MKPYEITYLTSGEETSEAKTIADILVGQQAKIASVLPWTGRRKLVYPIKKQDQAFYTTVIFEADPSAIAPLKRAIDLNEAVLRSLIVEHVPGAAPKISTVPSAETGQAAAPKPTQKEAISEPEAKIEELKQTKRVAASEVFQDETVEEPKAEVKDEPVTAPTAEPKKDKTLDQKLDELLNEDITK